MIELNRTFYFKNEVLLHTVRRNVISPFWVSLVEQRDDWIQKDSLLFFVVWLLAGWRLALENGSLRYRAGSWRSAVSSHCYEREAQRHEMLITYTHSETIRVILYQPFVRSILNETF